MFQVVRQGLVKHGVKAEAELTIKEIAVANDIDPMTLFENIFAVVTETQGH